MKIATRMDIGHLYVEKAVLLNLRRPECADDEPLVIGMAGTHEKPGVLVISAYIIEELVPDAPDRSILGTMPITFLQEEDAKFPVLVHDLVGLVAVLALKDVLEP